MYRGITCCACVLQELSLGKLREMQGRTHEDPLREVAALQYLASERHPNVLTCIEVRIIDFLSFWAHGGVSRWI